MHAGDPRIHSNQKHARNQLGAHTTHARLALILERSVNF